MKPIVVIAVIICSILMLSGCIYTHVTTPLSIELNKTDLGHKQGEASMYSVLWLVAWGNAGAAAAANNGGVTVLTHMDREFEGILFGIYTRTTTIVYGD
ncbi:MAG TPA: TRL domain-containing protein [Nitrospirota bacterium]|nr:TRL domain-containing protein [Nitrospirota bacterium]